MKRGLFGRPRVKYTVTSCQNKFGVLKAAYVTEAEAQAVANYRNGCGAPPLRVYKCERCLSWHLTSQPERKNVG